MTEIEIDIVKKTWIEVLMNKPERIGALFYEKLFEIAPETKLLFTKDIAVQSKKLTSMLNYTISKLDDAAIIKELRTLSIKHIEYNIKEVHYIYVGQALLYALEEMLDDFWTVEVKNAWIACYSSISNIMIAESRQKVSAF